MLVLSDFDNERMGHEFTPEERSRGGRISIALHPELKRLHAPYLRHHPAAQRAKAYRRMEIEQRVAKRLTEEGWAVYSPTVVCDRIGVKDDKVYFLEFKKENQTLRPGQQAINDLVPWMYRVNDICKI
ncbi:MAG: hypothetical protein OK449_03950 [Thaumarchaeota archaeon]|nr:hypothetical protein [Nitrososphaerota archaeon]